MPKNPDPDTVDPDAETPADPAAEPVEEPGPATITVEWRGRSFTVLASPDDWEIDATEAFGEIAASNEMALVGFRHISAFLRSILGPQQWAMVKKGEHRKASDAADLYNTIMQAYGERNRGE